jgi:hypothetical protein
VLHDPEHGQAVDLGYLGSALKRLEQVMGEQSVAESCVLPRRLLRRRGGQDKPPVTSHCTDALETEIADLVAEVAPQLLAEPGFGPLTAGKPIGEIAGAQRFTSDAKLARAAGIAPIPVSTGKTNRHRLDRGGNRQINTAIHRVAITRARCHPETQTYITRKTAESKTNREAIRCLKRHLARRIWHLLAVPDDPSSRSRERPRDWARAPQDLPPVTRWILTHGGREPDLETIEANAGVLRCPGYRPLIRDG